jgi:hypothetical protein
MKLQDLIQTPVADSKLSPASKSLILKECRPFLSSMHMTSSISAPYLYRGSKQLAPAKELQTFNTESVRKPRDTGRQLSTVVDQIYLHHFGLRFRSHNIVFTTGDENIAKTYGSPAAIFPIGPFRFLYLENITDLTLYLLKILQSSDSIDNICIKCGINEEEQYDLIQDLESEIDTGYFVDPSDHHRTSIVYKFLEYIVIKMGDPVVDNDLIGGVKSGHEIAIHCNTYFAVPLSFLT